MKLPKNYWCVSFGALASSGEDYRHFVNDVYDALDKRWKFTVTWHETLEGAQEEAQKTETPDELMEQIRLHMEACHKALKRLSEKARETKP